jgi:hypothetical protein
MAKIKFKKNNPNDIIREVAQAKTNNLFHQLPVNAQFSIYSKVSAMDLVSAYSLIILPTSEGGLGYSPADYDYFNFSAWLDAFGLIYARNKINQALENYSETSISGIDQAQLIEDIQTLSLLLIQSELPRHASNISMTTAILKAVNNAKQVEIALRKEARDEELHNIKMDILKKESMKQGEVLDEEATHELYKSIILGS